MDPNVKTQFFKYKATPGKVLTERPFRLNVSDVVEKLRCHIYLVTLLMQQSHCYNLRATSILRSN